MKVLFLASGNSEQGISPIIKNQGESLARLGIELEYLTITGKGIFGYLKNVWKLRSHFKSHNYDIIHAHYSLIGILASLAGMKPLLVSLMGSDVYEFRSLRFATKIFSNLIWEHTIVKTRGMKELLSLKNFIIMKRKNTNIYFLLLINQWFYF